ncbi:MAG: IS1634 family transposase, partial [Thermodesulfobium sp.]
VLKMEEEKDYLVRIKEGKSSKKSYGDHSRSFGMIHLLSDLHDTPEDIYRLYKKREYVEYAFNVLKNDLDADRSYLRDDRMLSSWMFLNIISLYLHFQILNMMDRMDGKYSVRDVLLILSRIKVYDVGKQEILGEMPKKSRELVESLNVDTEILRKN